MLELRKVRTYWVCDVSCRLNSPLVHLCNLPGEEFYKVRVLWLTIPNKPCRNAHVIAHMKVICPALVCEQLMRIGDGNTTSILQPNFAETLVNLLTIQPLDGSLHNLSSYLVNPIAN